MEGEAPGVAVAFPSRRFLVPKDREAEALQLLEPLEG
jgi:hypothetical protein